MSDRFTSVGEPRVLVGAASGELVDLSDLPEDERLVSAEVIRRLCIGPEASEVDPRGVRIKHARIAEPLDLSFCTVPHPLRFEATEFEEMLDLKAARLRELWIVDCSLPAWRRLRSWSRRARAFRHLG